MQPWALITPASRGIGLVLAQRLLRTTNVPVVATARGNLDEAKERILLEDSQDSQSNGIEGKNASIEKMAERLKVVELDVLKEDTIAAAAAEVEKLYPKKESYLHLAFSIPGILFPEKSPAQIDHNDALLTLRTNTLGPMMLIKHFSPFLPKKSSTLTSVPGLPQNAAVWANMSARVGSITDNGLGGWYSYRASKAGVNQVTKTFDNFLKMQSGEKACAMALHPGTVKTGLSKEFWGNVKKEKLFDPEFAVEKLMEVVRERGGEEGRGKCWDWKGEEIPP